MSLKLFTSILALTFLTHAGVINHNIESRQASCASTHIIVARGTGEASGEGEMGQLASAITSKVTGASSVALSYPASADYLESEETGTKNMLSAVESYVKGCPNSNIVLLGYSQGGQVVMDTLCGTDELGFSTTQALPTEYNDKIVAAVVYGDPSHVTGQSYDKGTATSAGITPRRNAASCNSYANRIQSYCDSGDPFCASGEDIAVHLGYFSKYDDEASSFVASKISGSSGSSSVSIAPTSAPSSIVPSVSATPTASGIGGLPGGGGLPSIGGGGLPSIGGGGFPGLPTILPGLGGGLPSLGGGLGGSLPSLGGGLGGSLPSIGIPALGSGGAIPGFGSSGGLGAGLPSDLPIPKE